MRRVMRGLFSRGLRGGFEGWVAWESGCKGSACLLAPLDSGFSSTNLSKALTGRSVLMVDGF
jgi:hypothetical protein